MSVRRRTGSKGSRSTSNVGDLWGARSDLRRSAARPRRSRRTVDVRRQADGDAAQAMSATSISGLDARLRAEGARTAVRRAADPPRPCQLHRRGRRPAGSPSPGRRRSTYADERIDITELRAARRLRPPVALRPRRVDARPPRERRPRCRSQPRSGLAGPRPLGTSPTARRRSAERRAIRPATGACALRQVSAPQTRSAAPAAARHRGFRPARRRAHVDRRSRVNAGGGQCRSALTGSAPLASDGALDLKIDGRLDAALANNALSLSAGGRTSAARSRSRCRCAGRSRSPRRRASITAGERRVPRRCDRLQAHAGSAGLLTANGDTIRIDRLTRSDAERRHDRGERRGEARPGRRLPRLGPRRRPARAGLSPTTSWRRPPISPLDITGKLAQKPDGRRPDHDRFDGHHHARQLRQRLRPDSRHEAPQSDADRQGAPRRRSPGRKAARSAAGRRSTRRSR